MKNIVFVLLSFCLAGEMEVDGGLSVTEGVTAASFAGNGGGLTGIGIKPERIYLYKTHGNSSFTVPPNKVWSITFVGSTGYFKFDQDTYIKTQNLEVAATNIQLSSTAASMSLGGVPGSAANILLDGGNSKIEVGSANKVTIQGGSSDNYISMGGKSSFSNEGSGTAGIIIGMDGSNTQAEFVKSSTEYFIFDGSSGIDIKTINFELNANTGDLQLSSAEKSMSLGDGGIILQGASSPYIQVGSSNSITLKTDGTDQYMIMGSKTSFSHLDATTVLNRAISEKGIYPAVDPLDSTSRILDPQVVGEEHYRVAREVQRILQTYKSLQDIIAILGMDELSEEDIGTNDLSIL